MYAILDQLHSEDYFNLQKFSDGVYFWKKSPQLASPENIIEAKEWVNYLQTIGGKGIIILNTLK